MIITYNLKPLFLKKIGSFSKSYLKLKLWVVKLLKLNIEKSWFDYQDTRCCNLAILNVLPKLLPGPDLHFRFMKNSVHMSLLGSLATTICIVIAKSDQEGLTCMDDLECPPFHYSTKPESTSGYMLWNKSQRPLRLLQMISDTFAKKKEKKRHEKKS